MSFQRLTSHSVSSAPMENQMRAHHANIAQLRDVVAKGNHVTDILTVVVAALQEKNSALTCRVALLDSDSQKHQLALKCATEKKRAAEEKRAADEQRAVLQELTMTLIILRKA